MRSILIVFMLLILVGGNCGAAAEPAVIEPDTPIWAEPSFSSRILFVTDQPFKQPEAAGMTGFYKKGSLYRQAEFFPLEAGGRRCWIAPEARVFKNHSGRAEIQFVRNDGLLGGSLLFIAAGIGVGVWYWRNRTRKSERKTDLFCIGLILAGSYSWLLVFLGYWARGQYRFPGDEFAYFRIAKDLLAWDFSTPFNMTIGHPLYYLPFILLLQAKTMFDLVPLLSWLSALILMPGTFVMFYFIVKKLSGSAWLSLAAALLWLAAPRFYFPIEIPVPQAVISWCWDFQAYSFTNYQCILTGFNTMSETVSVPTLMLTILLILYWPPSGRRYLCIGLLFGFSCLVRINNIMFAPLLIYLFWRSDRQLTEWRYSIRMLVLTILGFLLLFSGQLAVNQINFGSPLIFPYVLHGKEVYAGFQWRNVFHVAEYYFQIHFLYYSLALVSLFFFSDRVLRNILILWVVPLTLFFCGYLTGQPYRFLLPALFGVFAVLACNPLWRRLRCWQIAAVAVYIIVVCSPELPLFCWDGRFCDFIRTGWTDYYHVMLRLRFLLWPGLAGGMVLILRRQPAVLGFLGLWTLLVLIGQSMVIFIGFCGLLVWAFCSAGQEYGTAWWTECRRQKESSKTGWST